MSCSFVLVTVAQLCCWTGRRPVAGSHVSHSLDESEDYMHVDFSVSFKDRISRVNVYAEQVNAEQCLITKKTFF